MRLSSTWFFFLEGNDSNDERPPWSSQAGDAEDEPKGETDEQELGVYMLAFSIF